LQSGDILLFYYWDSSNLFIEDDYTGFGGRAKRKVV